mmetsp:Transcript_35413/g.89430  ORF Transcript_35413/g.89430 Transcript_35413/m.89430 type:complete len:215 (-) Transcript_35413:249-893(-)
MSRPLETPELCMTASNLDSRFLRSPEGCGSLPRPPPNLSCARPPYAASRGCWVACAPALTAGWASSSAMGASLVLEAGSGCLLAAPSFAPVAAPSSASTALHASPPASCPGDKGVSGVAVPLRASAPSRKNIPAESPEFDDGESKAGLMPPAVRKGDAIGEPAPDQSDEIGVDGLFKKPRASLNASEPLGDSGACFLQGTGGSAARLSSADIPL